jgi:hypothetical protein
MIRRPKDDSHRDTRRRFEQWARNPQCQANVISAVHNVRMAEVATLEGAKATMGQSPFAIMRGQAFEKALFRNEAASMTAALVKAGVLPANAHGFADLRLRLNGGRCRSLDEALERTAGLLREAASKRSRTSPWLVAGANESNGTMACDSGSVLERLDADSAGRGGPGGRAGRPCVAHPDARTESHRRLDRRLGPP